MNGCAVALRLDNGNVLTDVAPMVRGHAEHLLPMVQAIVARASLALPDVAGFVGTVGPGSFTGVRVGLSALKGFAFAAQVPVIGVSTFDVLALAAKQTFDTDNVCVIIETKRQDFYVRMPQQAGACMRGHDIAATLQPDIVLVGDGIPRFMDETGYKTDHAMVLDIASPALMFDVAAAKPHPLEPLYLREADTSISQLKIAKIV